MNPRHALVCGASEGIGRATAFALAGAGLSVTVLSRRMERLRELVSELPASDGQVHGCVATDANDSAGLASAVAALCAKRPVQVLVNNTAGPPGGPAHAAPIDQYLAVFRQHLVANQILVQAVLPGMREAGFGRIVNIISTSVKEPIANLGVSNTVRGAVASWAKTLASELGGQGITVNNVLPATRARSDSNRSSTSAPPRRASRAKTSPPPCWRRCRPRASPNRPRSPRPWPSCAVRKRAI